MQQNKNAKLTTTDIIIILYYMYAEYFCTYVQSTYVNVQLVYAHILIRM